MKITEMAIANAYRLTPDVHRDRRGMFFEAYRADLLSEAIGYPFVAGQGNHSVSRRNTVRGIHGTSIPPAQAKLVTCVHGAVLDVVVDLRIGSPTFGAFETTVQEAGSGVAVYLADGLGHAFQALTEGAAMSYVCSTGYVPGTMLVINPLDPDIGIPWELAEPPTISDKDASAPGLAAAEAAGMLPTYADCVAHYDTLRAGVVR
jgi:NDP-hexose 3,5-(Or5-) epimerase